MRGDADQQRWERQIDLRRRALQEVTLNKLVGPGDEVITKMASLLVELLKLNPTAIKSCVIVTSARRSPSSPTGQTSGDDDERGRTKAPTRRDNPLRPHSPFDDLEPIDPAEALGIIGRTDQ